MKRSKIMKSVHHKIGRSYGPLTQRQLHAILGEVFDLMADALRRGETIYIRGFGTMIPRYRVSKSSKTPGKRMVRVSFRPSAKVRWPAEGETTGASVTAASSPSPTIA